MARRDLTAFLEDDVLDYPGITSTEHPDGKTYRVPSPDARTGLWLTAMSTVGLKAVVGADLSEEDVASLQLDDDQEKTLYQRVLGPVYDEMMSDGVSWAMLQRIAQDAFLCFSTSQALADQALAHAAEAALGEAVAGPSSPASPKRTRSTARKTAGSSSKKASTGTRGRTRTQASTPSSTSPNASKEAAAAG